MPKEVPPKPNAEPEVPAKPRVSIVLVAHNCEPALRRALTALEASRDRSSFEILVVDAGSQDGTGRLDSDFPEITLLRLPRNFGRTRARNIATRSAQADLVLYLDPRVEVAPETVTSLAALLESRDECTAAVPTFLDEAGRPAPAGHVLPSAAELQAAALRAEPLPRASGEIVPAAEEYAVMVRRTFLLGMNYLDEKRFSEHWALLEVFWQIRNAGRKVAVCPAPATLHPAGAASFDEALLVADRVSGAAAYIAKHAGLGAAISFRLKCFLGALGSFKPGLAFSILGGSRIDPTQ